MPSAIDTSATKLHPWNLRNRLNVKSNPASATVTSGIAGLEAGADDEADAAATIVRFVESGPTVGVTVVGSNEHVTPEGSPLHAKLTAELKPFSGVTVNETDPCLPELTVIDDWDEVNENAGAPTTTSEAVVVAVLAPLVPVIVSVYVPVGTAEPAEIFPCDVPAPVTDAGLKVIEIPLG